MEIPNHVGSWECVTVQMGYVSSLVTLLIILILMSLIMYVCQSQVEQGAYRWMESIT